MKKMSRVLFLILLSLLTASCASDSGGGGVGWITPGSGPDGSVAKRDSGALGFYDIDKDGRERAVREDLTGGDLTGMVQFAQSHTIDPSGNAAKEMPSLVTERAALLLFTPLRGVANSVTSVKADVYNGGTLLGTLDMKHPYEMPGSDYINKSGKPDLVYSRRSWSAELPWNWVKYGMELRFTDNKGRTGVLSADAIEYGPAAEGVFVFLRLGMLTDPPAGGNGAMMTQPARAMAEYFQTTPFARIVNVRYEDRRLDRVIVADGDIYDVNSPDDTKKKSKTSGDVYSGDMRENVAKSQISVGINLANYGVASSSMTQSYKARFFQNTVHLAQGLYQNGTVRHGLSGGNGIGTLIDTVGNEFSHEVGHAYGMGHYPGSKNGDYFWSGHHPDSGWGYDAYKKRMRANVDWQSDGTGFSIGEYKSPYSFKGIYSYNRDSMSGGVARSVISRYTHYTGYTAKRIQNFLAARAVINSESPTGYVKWDPDNKTMAEFSFGEKENVLKPYKIGVPVITIIGGYDPDDPRRSVMYPYFRGNYGNVFRLPEPESDPAVRACWIKVDYLLGASDFIAVSAKRHAARTVNQFAVNIEESRAPVRAALYCREAGASAVQYAYQDIPTGLEPMPAPAIIGKENGYADVKREEAEVLKNQLGAYASMTIPSLTSAQEEMVLRLKDDLGLLGFGDAFSVASRFLDWREKAARASDFIYFNSDALKNGDGEAAKNLETELKTNGLFSGTLPAGGILKAENKCVRLETKNDGTYSVAEDNCTGGEASLWIHDGTGRIRSAAKPGLCLEGKGYGALLAVNKCGPSAAQRWSYDEAKSAIVWQNNAKQCMDRFRQNKAPGVYNCTGGSNQKWSAPYKSEDPFLTLLNADEAETVFKALKK